MAEQPRRKSYPSDLTDEEWQRIEPHVPAPKPGGRPRLHPIREILNAIFWDGSLRCDTHEIFVG